MKKNKNIIDFFEGNLNESEKEKLFEEINQNADLKKEYENFNQLYSLLRKSKEFKPSEDYLENIIPRFRSKSQKKSIVFKPAFASGLVIIFTIAIIYLLNFSKRDIISENDEFDNVYELSFVQQDDLENMASLIDKEIIDELLIEEMTDKENRLSLLENYFYIDNNFNILPETESEEIYQELITKKIL